MKNFKSIKIRTPSKDVCDECFIFKKAVYKADLIEEIEKINTDQSFHISSYRELRENYENDPQIAMNK